MTQPVRLGLLGCGVIGNGVIQLLQAHQPEIASRIGTALTIHRILIRDTTKARPAGVPSDRLTTDPAEIVDAPEVDVVIEVLGGLQPAGDIVLRALRNRKPVVTANKELLAKAGRPLFEAADEHGVPLQFEASVCAGVPILRALREGLAAEKVDRVLGIVNGTTNYILTRMSRDHQSFEEALREAQAKGYAEPDPAADVDGLDAACKIAILASLAFHTYVPFDAVRVEGIGSVTLQDIAFAADLGYVIKSLAVARERDGAVDARVQPTFIPKEHPLAAVQDVYNAVFVKARAAGDLMFYGRGAGPGPTASAILADVIGIIGHCSAARPVPAPLRFTPKPIRPHDDACKAYIRMQVVDRPGVLAVIAEAFGQKNVSLESVLQPKSPASEGATPLVFTTHAGPEKNLRAALDRIGRLPVVKAIGSVIRIEEEM
jgi:homoserine dehydrogenase